MNEALLQVAFIEGSQGKSQVVLAPVKTFLIPFPEFSFACAGSTGDSG
jgi:hypothetical protein